MGPGHLAVVVAGDQAAGGQRPRQQGWVVDIAGDLQGLVGRLHGTCGARNGGEHGLIEAAQSRWRAVNAPHLVALVRAGARFENGKHIERPDETTTKETAT